MQLQTVSQDVMTLFLSIIESVSLHHSMKVSIDGVMDVAVLNKPRTQYATVEGEIILGRNSE